MNWFIDLTQEQKENTRYITLYRDELSPEAWSDYCLILDLDEDAEIIRVQVCGAEEVNDYDHNN